MKKRIILSMIALTLFFTLSAQKQLDSICSWNYTGVQDSIFIFKQKYTYDAAGRNTSVACYTYDSQFGWTCAYFFPGNDEYYYGRFDYLYDESGNLTEKTGYSGGGITWGRATQELNEYDTGGNPVSWQWQEWSSKKKSWVPLTRKEYVYTGEGPDNTVVRYERDTELNLWRTTRKDEISFDASGKRSCDLVYLWNNTSASWTLSSKTEWKYDSFGNEIVRADSSRTWDGNKFTWLETSRREGITDATGHLLSESWNTGDGTSSRFVYTYDSGGRLLSKIWSRKYPGGDWKEHEKTERTYDPAGQLLTETWIGNISDFDMVLLAKVERKYDPSRDLISATYYDSPNYNRNNFIFWFRDFYFYRPGTTGTANVPASRITTYPNPTKGLVNITGLSGPAKGKIYTLQGILLRTIEQIENTIDISELPAGVYVLQVTNGNNVSTQSLIVKQ